VHASGPGVLQEIVCGAAPSGKWHATVQLVPVVDRVTVPPEGSVPPVNAGADENPNVPPHGWHDAHATPAPAWRSWAPTPQAWTAAARATAVADGPSAPASRFGSTPGP
jgi:hypothetical protein